MSNLNDEEIGELKVIKKLLGYIEPVGETYEDEERLKNVQKYNEILCFIVFRLKEASNYKDRLELSINKIGSECYDILQELKESLEEMIDE